VRLLFRRRETKVRSRRVRKLRLLALLGVLGLVCSVSFTYGLVMALASEIPELDPRQQAELEEDGYIYSSDGVRLATLRGSESRVVVDSNDIAPVVKQAIVAVEDRRFWEHRGVDIRGIARAVWADIREKELVQGGSTITQQFVKNTLTRKERTVSRKLKEAALAWQLERRWSKDRILTAYLNTVYFGNGAYGIEIAAKVYFGKKARDLTLPEAALLAGIPANPSAYDPVTRPSAARARRATVLELMRQQGLVTKADFRKATAARLPAPEDVRLPFRRGPAQHFVEYVKQQLIAKYGAGEVFGGGLHITTTIDLELQRMARAAVEKWLGRRNGPSAALVAIDPRDGRVLAMYGGSSFRESQFNLAVQGERQAGSAFKPFVLAAALSLGISPQTVFESRPTTINLGDKLWTVANYEGSYLGSIDLYEATTHSDNAVYTQLTSVVGPRKVRQVAHALGVTSPLNDYFAIGLGVEAVNPLEMARAFATFANDGARIDGTLLGNAPRAVASIRSDGRVVRNRPEARQVLDPNDNRTLTHMLVDVVEDGTGQRADLPERPVAGKTGTTENYGDAWFVGYTPQLAVAVWVGYPNKLIPMETEFNGDPVAGGTFPALIWKTFAQSAVRYMKEPPAGFPYPDYEPATPVEVVFRNGRWLVDNGLCDDSRQVLFVEGFAPTRRADCKPNEVDVPRVIGATVEAAEARLASMPLHAQVITRPAKLGERVDVVVDQYPKSGTLSSWDTVRIVLPKPVEAVVPNVVGLRLSRARELLEDQDLLPVVEGLAGGDANVVIAQSPRGRVAASDGMVVKLRVGRG
jgi:penicillin-binding protein 1A